MSNKDLVRRLYAEGFDADRAEVFDELVDPSFRIHGGPGSEKANDNANENDENRDDAPARPTGPDALKFTNTQLHKGFPGFRIRLDDLVEEGEKVAVRWTLQGTNTGELFGRPASGRPVELRATVIFRIRDGRMTDLWPLLDEAGLQRQLAG